MDIKQIVILLLSIDDVLLTTVRSTFIIFTVNKFHK